ncbi:hypothetical protein HJFPF1_09707 [Paramyrothecium foliicola]|nr:hypothetical protein HJFPF1_09707 [Paramyrothecium foliicola]
MAPTATVDTHQRDALGFRPSQSTTKGAERFDAAIHLAFSPPSKTLTMRDIGLELTALSPIATTEPLPFMPHEAVLAHRRELFSKPVFDNCLFHTRPGSIQLRGMAPRYAPFIHEFWHSPEVLKIISEQAGVDLVPAMDYEISHTNVQLGPGGVDSVRNTPVEPSEATPQAIAAPSVDKKKKRAVTDQSKPIIEWHKDSHPWVCVVMLSDARNMVGGETELMIQGDGTTIKVRGPTMGCATLLQGRYITHTAAPCENMPERVRIVTSFRFSNPVLVDKTTNDNICNKSHLSELYYQWATYCLDVMAQRASIAADALRIRYTRNVAEANPEGKPGCCRVETVDVEEVRGWAEEMIKYVNQIMYEMRPLGQYT